MRNARITNASIRRRDNGLCAVWPCQVSEHGILGHPSVQLTHQRRGASRLACTGGVPRGERESNPYQTHKTLISV
jgi:hypothetical protein